MNKNLYASDLDIRQLECLVDTTKVLIQERIDFRMLYQKEQVEKAMYKAYFYGKSELAELLRKQDRMNNSSLYTFRSLEDMKNENIISEEDYVFCV